MLMTTECKTYPDPLSGVEVTQLTDYKGHSHHLYFTNPGWYAGGRKLLFGSDRNNRTNLFGVDLASGDIEQLTDLAPVPPPRELDFLRTSKNPLREEAYFWHDLDLLALDLVTRRTRVLYRTEPGWSIMMTNTAADGRHVYFGLSEDLSSRFRVDMLRGYVGFRETWEAKPLSRIIEVDIDTGAARTIFEEQYWIGHVNTSPTHANMLTFCHEGPWKEVDQRIWGLDVTTGRVWPIRRTTPPEEIGHEYWYADGERLGYHGLVAGGKSILGTIRFDDTQRTESAFAAWTGHIFSLDEKLIVGDGGKIIRIWKLENSSYQGPRVLCRHDSSMNIQQTHPHPRIAPDGQSVVFSSDRSGYGNVYRVSLADFDSLPPVKE